MGAFAAIGIGVGVLAALLWFLPILQVRRLPVADPEKSFNLKNEARKTWAQIFGGLILLAGLFFSWRTITVTERGQITDRFSKAVDQLGTSDDPGKASNLFLRLGGIYALERIAEDSERDHNAVFALLTEFVKSRAPGAAVSGDDPVVPPADIQAILTVIGRRSRRYLHGESSRLDLAGTDLRGAMLMDADLAGCMLNSAHLEHAHLERANLRKAMLFDGRLRGAFLKSATLSSAQLQGANLRSADLSDVDLTDADLTGADLRGAIGLKPEMLWSAKGHAIDTCIRNVLV
jgi:Pentapeptide repeats (8 copies)